MARLLVLTPQPGSATEVLPALSVLGHQAAAVLWESTALLPAAEADLVVVDGRRDLVRARALTQLLRTTGSPAPVLLVLSEGGLGVVNADWGMDDVVLAEAGAAEVEARIRLLMTRSATAAPTTTGADIEVGELQIDASGYTVRLRGRMLDLTYKEFELLKYLATNPGRVYTRAQLLQEVWGYDYFGGTRTVDVHVRRLRAKLGPENDSLISTVRNVGYRLDIPGTRERGPQGAPAAAPAPVSATEPRRIPSRTPENQAPTPRGH